MGSYYTVLGKKIPAHFLALGTYGSVIGGVMMSQSSTPAANETNTAAKPVEAAKPAVESSNDDFDIEKMLNSLLKEETK